MIPNQIIAISAAAFLTFSQLAQPLLSPLPQQQVLASHEFSLEKRYEVKSVSEVFRDNILLNLAYMSGKVSSKKDINWDEIKHPFHYELSLNPGEVFAYHDDVLAEYRGKLGHTSRAHFTAEEGFKTDGYLFGDGVCHLASLIYWVAKDANLDAKAPTNHDFMVIPEIDRQYGVSIFSNPYSKGSHALQNLYVTNNKNKPISFMFDYADNKLKISVAEVN